MSEQTLDQHKTVSLRPGYRFQWEEAQRAYVLLYPEGMVKLNGSAAEIMKHCDQQRSVKDIIAQLSAEFPDVPELAKDVVEFLQIAENNGWIELHE